MAKIKNTGNLIPGHGGLLDRLDGIIFAYPLFISIIFYFMKKRIAILGSTGSIGKQTIEILKKDKRNFLIDLLLANSNIKLLSKQIKEFKVKNIIVKDYKSYLILKKFKNLNISNNINDINKLIKGKVDYAMSAVSGLDGLSPRFQIIQKTKSIAIANKSRLFVVGTTKKTNKKE